jgi:DNA-binding IscR family transcriptional regulator
VETVEGPFGVTRCIMQDRACGEGASCTLHEAWEEGERATLEYLGDQSLQDFVAQNPSGNFPQGLENPKATGSPPYPCARDAPEVILLNR